jgi:PAS domain S-box-containing protein
MLGHPPPAASPPAPAAFDRDHLRLLTDKLAENVQTLQQTNAQLSALVDFSLHLASEHHPARLLEALCHTARALTGARYAVAGLLGEDSQLLQGLFTSGMDAKTAAQFAPPLSRQGLLGTLLGQPRACRQSALPGDPRAVGLPSSHPPVHSLLAAPIVSPTQVYGWLCLTNKLGTAEFSAADERLTGILAAQVGRIYESARLYTDAQAHALELEEEIAERQRVQQALAERMRLATLAADIGLALTRGETLPQVLQQCAEAMVRHLDVAFARIWTLHPAENVLELQASAGLYTHLDGPHSRVPVGSLKIGLIAQARQPLLTNAVLGDPRIADQEWARREGMVAFAGHPLLVNDRVAGVMAMFARHPLPETILDALTAVADEIALGIERLRTEAALQEREWQLRALFDSTMNAVAVTDDAGVYLEANPAACVLVGLAKDQLLGRRFTDFATPEAALDEVWRLFREQGQLRTEFRLQRPDGTVRDVECQAVAHFIPGRHLLMQCDITEHKRLEAQLLQAQKMEAIGRLAGGIAHDFNNMLTIIKGYGELLLENMPAQEPRRRAMEEIQKAADRSATLTQQLLAFSRKQTLQPVILNLNTVVAEVSTMLRRLVGEDIALLTRLDPALGLVTVDPGQVEQIIINLAVNARAAMPAGGMLSIETANVEVEETYLRLHPEVSPGAYVRLTVSDTGHGMDNHVKAHLFEPFFTTKAPGQGTGLGLASVYGMVTQSGGHVAVYSEPGQGATFMIYLPRVAETVVAAPPPAPVAERLHGTETLLLVEDDAAVRELLRHVLETNGYTVLEASQGDEAMALCAHYQGVIHLLVTDVVMPGMSGPHLAERLGAARPGLKVLCLSGYTEHPLIHRGVLAPEMAFLHKPFTPPGLLQKVREVLGPQDDGASDV